MTKENSVNVDRLAILAALLGAGAIWAATLGETASRFLVQGRAQILLLALWTIVCIPLAFGLPRVHCRVLGRLAAWHVPAHTYLLPRWAVRFCIGGAVGQLVGMVLLAFLKHPQVLWFAGSILILGTAFVAGACGRLAHHPSTEFTMPWWLSCQKSLRSFSRSAQLDMPSEHGDIEE